MTISSPAILPLLWNYYYAPSNSKYSGSSLRETVNQIHYYLDFVHLSQTSKAHSARLFSITLEQVDLNEENPSLEDKKFTVGFTKEGELLQQKIYSAYLEMMAFLRNLSGTTGLIPPDCTQELLDSRPLQFAASVVDVLEAPPLLKNIRMRNQNAVITLLRCGATATTRAPSGLTPLEMSIQFDLQDVVEELCKTLSNLDTSSRDKDTPLHLAVGLPSAQTLRILLKHSFYKTPQGLKAINAVNEEGYTPLIHAAQREHPEHLQALLTAGSSVDIICPVGWPALAHAIAHSPLDLSQESTCVQLLLDHGASANTPISTSATVLSLACILGRVGIAQQLVSAGAFIYIVDCEEEDQPIELARARGFQELVDWLEAQSPYRMRPPKRKLTEALIDVLPGDACVAVES